MSTAANFPGDERSESRTYSDIVRDIREKAATHVFLVLSVKEAKEREQESELPQELNLGRICTK